MCSDSFNFCGIVYSSKLQNMVCLVPVERLDTNILHCWFDKAMRCLDKIFLEIAVSADIFETGEQF